MSGQITGQKNKKKSTTPPPTSTSTGAGAPVAGGDRWGGSEAKVQLTRSSEGGMNRKDLDWALMVAADTGDLVRVKELIEAHKADPNHTHRQGSQSGYNKGSTPLMYACRSGHLPVVDYLLQTAGADPHVVEDELWNSLHYSCFSGHEAISARLLGLKVDTTLITMFEKATPMGFASHRKFCSVVPLFKDPKQPEVQPFTKAEADPVLERGLNKLTKGRKNVATKGRFLFRYELRDDAFDVISLFLSSFEHPKAVQFPAFDHISQMNCVGSMFKVPEDRNAFVQQCPNRVIRSSSVSGVQHVVFWIPSEKDDSSPRILVE